MKLVASFPSTTTVPSLVVKLTVVPATVETWALPVSSMALMLLSVKLRRRLLLAESSTRPTFGMLTEALLWGAVLIVDSVNTVPPETIFWPFTVTCPETDNSPDALAPAPANATIE
jgi:hypothetical protein